MAVIERKLDSSHLEEFTYDDATCVMVMTFKGGARYRFRGIPRQLIDGLSNADSPGAYFAAHIKKTYEGERLN